MPFAVTVTQVGLKLLYVEPGSPWQNGFAESFFSRLSRRAVEHRGVRELGRGPLVRGRRLKEHNEERPTVVLVTGPVGICVAVCCFRSGSGYASALTPAAHCGTTYSTPTLITLGTKNGAFQLRLSPHSSSTLRNHLTQTYFIITGTINGHSTNTKRMLGFWEIGKLVNPRCHTRPKHPQR